MKIMVATFVMAVALMGCSKKKANTTPTNNTSGTATEMKSDGEHGRHDVRRRHDGTRWRRRGPLRGHVTTALNGVRPHFLSFCCVAGA